MQFLKFVLKLCTKNKETLSIPSTVNFSKFQNSKTFSLFKLNFKINLLLTETINV